MNMFEFNKIAGALLFSALVVLGVANLADMIYETDPANPSAYVVEGVTTDHGATTAPSSETAAPAASLATLLANADPAAGEKVAKKCVSCHTFDQGGANKIGPHLYGVVGRPLAHVADFGYSQAMREKGGAWTFEALFAYLAKPSDYVPGTAMSFAGVSKDTQRADLIAYLNTLGSNLPLPSAAAPAPAASATPSIPAEASPSSPVDAVTEDTAAPKSMEAPAE